MKIYITSDWHFEVSELRNFPLELPAFDVAVVAGDVDRGIARSVRRLAETPVLAGKPVIFVPGNHEFDDGIYQDVLAEGRRALAVQAAVALAGGLACATYAGHAPFVNEAAERAGTFLARTPLAMLKLYAGIAGSGAFVIALAFELGWRVCEHRADHEARHIWYRLATLFLVLTLGFKMGEFAAAVATLQIA